MTMSIEQPCAVGYSIGNRRETPLRFTRNNLKNRKHLSMEENAVIALLGSPGSSSPNKNVLAYYPPLPAIGSLAITRHDCSCLKEHELLNDVIVNFYLSYLTREALLPEDGRRVHLFSSFFFSRLARDDPPSSDSDEPASMEQRHARVGRWTKHVNIFDKDFVIVPINRHDHWLLAIICFPGTATRRNSNTSSEQFVTGGEFQSPSILMFDSLGCRDRPLVDKILRGYLRYECLAKFGAERSFSDDAMKTMYPRVPRQTNATDCGLYVLQYAENFLKEPIKAYASGLFDLSDWFEPDVIRDKRRQIGDLIKKLSIDRDESRRINGDASSVGSSHDVVVMELTGEVSRPEPSREDDPAEKENLPEWITLRRYKAPIERRPAATPSGKNVPEAPEINSSRRGNKRAALSDVKNSFLDAASGRKKIKKGRRLQFNGKANLKRRANCDPQDPLYNLSIDALYNDSTIDPSVSYQEWKRRMKMRADDSSWI